MVVWVLGDGGISVVVLDFGELVEFRRRVMRLICFVSDLVMWGGDSCFRHWKKAGSLAICPSRGDTTCLWHWLQVWLRCLCDWF